MRTTTAWRERVFDWQPFLIPALQHGLIVADERAAEAVGRMTGEQPLVAMVKQRLDWAATYIDEPRWCQRTAQQLGFDSVAFIKDDINPYFPVRLAVSGAPAGLEAAELVSVIRRTLAFRRCERLMLDLIGGRLAVALGELAYARVGGVDWESREPITAPMLQQLEELGLPIATVLHETHSITA